MPREEDCINVDSEDDDESTSQKKGKNRNKRCKDKAVMTAEGSGTHSTGKTAKAEAPGKEAAVCADCRDATVAEKSRKGDGPYSKIQRTKGHDLQECIRLSSFSRDKE